MNETLLFAHGTCRRGGSGHQLLLNTGARYVCQASLVQRHPMLVRGEIPTLLDQPGIGYNVIGELYRVPPAALGTLDLYEGSNRRRKLATIKVLPIGQEYEAWVYVAVDLPAYEIHELRAGYLPPTA